jgi:O-antigen ligase
MVRKPHDDYLEVFARTGIVGLALFLWILIAALTPVVRRVRRGDGAEARFCVWILAASCVYLLIAATQPLLAFPYGTVPLFTLLGMGIAAAERSGRLSQGASGRNVPVTS